MIPCNYTLKNSTSSLTQQIPVVDIGSLIHGIHDPSVVEDVCFGANFGAFQVINHGINDKQVACASNNVGMLYTLHNLYDLY